MSADVAERRAYRNPAASMKDLLKKGLALLAVTIDGDDIVRDDAALVIEGRRAILACGPAARRWAGAV